ncbi:cucumber peeling cupredoxin-like [Macadamia integrifolia]|uniref:cucumber peeling cupredoxin-like n=1 Tax=Macadamia integrifolia TaxID=60698 RepID=UPI001C4F5DA3|nr:cucumber peeling cupredoxin-like [Macadamia integrifolia]
MASCTGYLLGCVFIVAALLQGATAAQTIHVVGDSIGWTIPPSNFAYQTWAANQTFMTGDELMFNFTNGAQDVAEFLKTDYESCNVSLTNAISPVFGSSLYITIETAGEHYYTTTVVDHCKKNQKLTIIAYGTPISSPPSSATSLTNGGFSLFLLLLLSTAIALF